MSDLEIVFVKKNGMITDDIIKAFIKESKLGYFPDDKHKSSYFDVDKMDTIWSRDLNSPIRYMIKHRGGTIFSLWHGDFNCLFDIRESKSEGIIIFLSIPRVVLEKKEDINFIITMTRTLYNKLGFDYVFGDLHHRIQSTSEGKLKIPQDTSSLWLNITKERPKEFAKVVKLFKIEKLKDGSFLVLRNTKDLYDYLGIED